MKHISLFLMSFIFWLLLSFSLETSSLITGLVVALLTTLIFGIYFESEIQKFLQPKRYFWFIIYLIVFIWECIKANFDIAYRVIHPRIPIKPGIVRVPLHIKSSFARAMLANSITMTPGTITIDIVGDDLFVHWIYISTHDPVEYTRKVSGRFEGFIKKILE